MDCGATHHGRIVEASTSTISRRLPRFLSKLGLDETAAQKNAPNGGAEYPLSEDDLNLRTRPPDARNSSAVVWQDFRILCVLWPRHEPRDHQ